MNLFWIEFARNDLALTMQVNWAFWFSINHNLQIPTLYNLTYFLYWLYVSHLVVHRTVFRTQFKINVVASCTHNVYAFFWKVVDNVVPVNHLFTHSLSCQPHNMYNEWLLIFCRDTSKLLRKNNTSNEWIYSRSTTPEDLNKMHVL